MANRALTASEATARAIALGYKVGKSNWVKDNVFTKPYGPTTMKFIDPEPNMFFPAMIAWRKTGVAYYVYLTESQGRSNIRLYRVDYTQPCACGDEIANYNQMNAATKKLFMEALETAERYEAEPPQEMRTGFKDARYQDENGVAQTAWYDPEGNYCTMKDRERYMKFREGEKYE